jgi:hypothetical protein
MLHPERVTIDGDDEVVRGTLTGFIIVDDGELVVAHTVGHRRRQEIARELVKYAQYHHGLRSARGPFTDDGRAFTEGLYLERKQDF